MQQSPWSASRTILLIGVGITLLVYALLGTSSRLSCSAPTARGRSCTLTRYFLFMNDPFAGLFDGVVLHWENPATGKDATNIRLATRDGQGTMPAIGGSDWLAFLQAQLAEFRRVPWQYLWQGVLNNRNLLITASSIFGFTWALFLYTSLRGANLK